MTGSEAVVLDTGVFTAVLKAGSDIATEYANEIVGKRIVIFQTEAEARYGALAAGWGKRRVRELEDRLERAVVVPPQADLAKECAQLRFECRSIGHAFQDRHQAADLWVAATARWTELDLVTHDGAFTGLPGVNVICRA